MSVFNEQEFKDGLVSELGLFDLPSTQTSVTEFYDEEVRPISQVSADGPLEFRINAQNSLDYLDLKNSQIYVKVNVVKADGTDLSGEKVGPANLFLQSLFSTVELTLQNKATITCNYNPYRAYIPTLLKYGGDALSSQLKTQGWYIDDADSPGVTDPTGANSGVFERSAWIATSKTLDLQGPIFHDLCDMDRYLLNQVDVKIKFYRNPATFALLAIDNSTEFKINIQDIYVIARKVRLNSAVSYGQAKMLEKNNALYPYTKKEVRVQTIATGSSSFNWENVFQGKKPERVIVGFVKSKALNGDYTTNPFNFENCDITQIAVYNDGLPVGGNPMKTKFSATSTECTRAYTNLLQSFGKWRQDEGFALDLAHFKSGSTLFAFQSEPNFSHHGEYLSLVKNGNSRLTVQFGTTLSVAAKKESKRKTEEVSTVQAVQAEPVSDADDSTSIYYSFLAKKTDLKICQLWDYVYLKKKDKCVMFYQEYGQLPSGLKYPHDAAMVPRNRELNRYRGLYAYDHSRVTLEVDNAAETDYINACFINGYEKPRKFIASQGPTKKMRNDFWRMVWQQKSKVIIMLTNLTELGSEKCVLYWPDKEKSDEVTFGKITIKLVSEDPMTDYTIRKMEIFKDDPEDKLSITQFHFVSWPDKSTPDSSWSLVKFWRKVSEDTRNLTNSGPMVVHCSAGIGRTGTYIALDVAYHKARSEGAVKIKEVVTTLRDQRVSMVQTADQYVYIHEAIAEAFLFGTHHIWSGQLEEVYEYFNQPMDGIQTTRLETQFNFIKESIEDKRSVQSSAEEGENIYNNIFNKQRELKSGEDYRPKSKSMKYVQEVGALILPNHEEKGTFIISKCPEDSRMTEFWSLVQEQNVKTVVSLGSLANSKRSSVLGTGNGMIKDKFGLTLDEERKTSTFVERKFSVKDNQNQDVKVTHFEFSNLTVNDVVPKDTSSILQLLEAVMNCQRQFSETEPILVYCKSGFQHCGLVCVLLSELNRMNREGGQINVVHTVKTMKERHDDVIGSFEQYQYVYDALLEHVRDSTYQNQ